MHRLRDSGAGVLTTNIENAGAVAPLRDQLPDLHTVFAVDGAAPGALCLQTACHTAYDGFSPIDTAADDPAMLIYTSGTTGHPKGALHAHRVLLGHLPGVEMSHDFFPKPDDLIWTPADWAWIGGLLDVLMLALHHGVPVLAHRFASLTGKRRLI